MNSQEISCRICFDPIVFKRFKMIGCSCVINCHDWCLDKWFNHQGRLTCPICHSVLYHEADGQLHDRYGFQWDCSICVLGLGLCLLLYTAFV